MKGKLNLILFSFVFFCCQEKHDIPETIPQQKFKIPRDIVPYDFSSRIKEQSDADSNLERNDLTAFQYSNIGKYFAALEISDRSYPQVPDQLIYFDSSKYMFQPAIDYICRQAQTRQIVIINEAHHVSYHRFFSMLLIQKLKALGFNYFGAETLNRWDSTLNKKDYPTLTTGYYTVEPQYGNLIRTAINCGYRLFAYESDSITSPKQREIDQATNIARILKENKNARIVIHCGYSHLYKGRMDLWDKAMAGRLLEFTGIDPLCIDQVELTEHADPSYENAYFKKMDLNEFVVPVTKKNQFALGFNRDSYLCDMYVYHPRTKLLYNRPNWLFGYYNSYFINKEVSISFPVLCKAYLAGEDTSEAIPLDIIEIDNSKDSTALALLSNKAYKIVLRNQRGQRQTLDLDLRKPGWMLVK